MAKENKKTKKTEVKMSDTNVVEEGFDRDCPIHGSLKARGKVFEGIVTKKFSKRIAIEFQRTVYIRKYERYARSRTKIHARLPDCMKNEINIGDLVKVRECRPLSKIIHSVVIEKIKDADKVEEKKKK